MKLGYLVVGVLLGVSFSALAFGPADCPPCAAVAPIPPPVDAATQAAIDDAMRAIAAARE